MTNEEAKEIFLQCVNNPHIMKIAFWKEENLGEDNENEEEYFKRLSEMMDGDLLDIFETNEIEPN